MRVLQLYLCLILCVLPSSVFSARDTLLLNVAIEQVDLLFFRAQSGTFVAASAMDNECELNLKDPASQAFVRATFKGKDDQTFTGPVEVDILGEDGAQHRYTFPRFQNGKVRRLRFFDNKKHHMLFGPFSPQWPYRIIVRHGGKTATLANEHYCQG